MLFIAETKIPEAVVKAEGYTARDFLWKKCNRINVIIGAHDMPAQAGGRCSNSRYFSRGASADPVLLWHEHDSAEKRLKEYLQSG
jgi:hypothetical protein